MGETPTPGLDDATVEAIQADALAGPGHRLSHAAVRRLAPIVCGGSECPTCGRQTEAMLGPCAECCESHTRTGRFLRRVVDRGRADG